jgi:hypothetical protein
MRRQCRDDDPRRLAAAPKGVDVPGRADRLSQRDHRDQRNVFPRLPHPPQGDDADRRKLYPDDQLGIEQQAKHRLAFAQIDPWIYQG